MSAHRSGQYVRQTTGYTAFYPAPLTSDFQLDLNRLLNRLSRADQAIGGLNSISGFVPHLPQFVAQYARKDAVLSNQIEGIHTTYTEMVEYEAGVFKVDDDSDLRETKNYLDALWFGLDRQAELPMSLRLICEMHEVLMRGVRGERQTPGEFRRSQNWIGPRGSTLSSATFVPPPVEVMKDALYDLENFIYREDQIPPLIRIGLIHAQFETIHPFLDGNGRMGRLLITYLLVHYKILEHPILYASLVMRLNRDEYYRRLQAVRDQGDWEGWLEFFLDCIMIAAQDAFARTREIVELQRRLQKIIGEKAGRSASSLYQILESLQQLPITWSAKIQTELGVTPTTANKYIQELVSLQILTQTDSRQRNRYYRYSPYIEILEREVVLPQEIQGQLFE